jgi:hypothetical protein
MPWWQGTHLTWNGDSTFIFTYGMWWCSLAEICKSVIQTNEVDLLAVCLDYALTLKLESVYSFKISGNFYQTKWRHIPEDSKCRENHEFHISLRFNWTELSIIFHVQWASDVSLVMLWYFCILTDEITLSIIEINMSYYRLFIFVGRGRFFLQSLYFIFIYDLQSKLTANGSLELEKYYVTSIKCTTNYKFCFCKSFLIIKMIPILQWLYFKTSTNSARWTQEGNKIKLQK